MDFGKMLSDSFEYSKNGLFRDIGRWILLFICLVFHPLWLGYEWKIYKGEPEMPVLEDWIGMLVNGVKLIIVNFVYLLIPILVFVVSGGLSIVNLLLTNPDEPIAIATAAIAVAVALMISVVVLFIFALLGVLANVRFARTDNFGEAFNFTAILEHIRKIGWGSYILSLIIWFLVLLIALIIAIIICTIVGVILSLIPIVGIFLTIIEIAIALILIAPFFGVWATRYITMIYDSAE